jgi:VWFA-related protein
MGCERGRLLAILIVVLTLALRLAAQEPLPDAPLPQNNVPATSPQRPSNQQPAPDAPPTTRPPQPAPPASEAPAAPGQPQTPGNTVPPDTTAPAAPESARDQLFTLSRDVNFVVVPVTVKDPSGHLMEGLLKNDFTVYENGSPQQVKFFTSDPFPLSAAVVIDLALPDVELKKVNNTLSALTGAFSQFDELAIFTYGNTVRKMQDFTAVNDQLGTTLRRLKNERGRTGVPVMGGPLGQSSPTINNRPVEPQTPAVQTMPKDSAVLNDALLAAALELAKRSPTRRKILFVISDGREVGSNSSYGDVLGVLLSRQIQVYAVAVGSGAIPGYRQLEKIRVPGLGYGDILPKYASATGGEVFPEMNEQAIETAYARVTEEARNQYTIGYTTRATPSSTYRSIEVRVNRPGLKVYAKDGYYPLPPGK